MSASRCPESYVENYRKLCREVQEAMSRKLRIIISYNKVQMSYIVKSDIVSFNIGCCKIHVKEQGAKR